MAKNFRKIIALAVFSVFLGTNAGESFAAKKPFGDWLEDLKAEALTKGISQPIINEAFKNVKFKEKIVTLDRKQPRSNSNVSAVYGETFAQIAGEYGEGKDFATIARP